jgi:hypothetical protein
MDFSTRSLEGASAAIPDLEVALRRGGVHVSRTVVTRWFARTGAASAVRGGYPACGSSCTPSGLRTWAECARVAAHPLRSVTGCRAMQLRALVLGWRGVWLAARLGEVSMCALLTHSMAMPRAAVGNRCSHRTSAPQRAVEVSGIPPAAGVSWCGDGVPGDPLRLLWKRATLSVRGSADSAGWVELAGWVDPRSAWNGRWCVGRV